MRITSKGDSKEFNFLDALQSDVTLRKGDYKEVRFSGKTVSSFFENLLPILLPPRIGISLNLSQPVSSNNAKGTFRYTRCVQEGQIGI